MANFISPLQGLGGFVVFPRALPMGYGYDAPLGLMRRSADLRGALNPRPYGRGYAEADAVGVASGR